MIKSINFDQDQIIKDVIRLYCPQGIEVDPTYSIGNFYKKEIKKPLFKFDIAPQVPGVIPAVADNLPLLSGSISSILFDPPFLATKGKSIQEQESGNIINKRFGVYENERDLHGFYIRAMKEFYRILKPKGILIFKCQDKVSSQKQYFSHCFIMYEAFRIGFYPKDLFILMAKSRVVANWQLRNQQHARKFHCYFWVFVKENPKVDYFNIH